MIMLLFSLICFLTIYTSERTFSHISHLPAFEVSRKQEIQVGRFFFFTTERSLQITKWCQFSNQRVGKSEILPMSLSFSSLLWDINCWEFGAARVVTWRTSLVLQWLRLFPVQGARVWLLLRELRKTCHVVQPKKKKEPRLELWGYIPLTLEPMLPPCTSHTPSLGPFSSGPALACPQRFYLTEGRLGPKGLPLPCTSLQDFPASSCATFQPWLPQPPTLPFLPPSLQTLRSTNILQFSSFSKENPPQFFFSIKLPLPLSPLFHYQVSWGKRILCVLSSQCPHEWPGHWTDLDFSPHSATGLWCDLEPITELLCTAIDCCLPNPRTMLAPVGFTLTMWWVSN